MSPATSYGGGSAGGGSSGGGLSYGGTPGLYMPPMMPRPTYWGLPTGGGGFISDAPISPAVAPQTDSLGVPMINLPSNTTAWNPNGLPTIGGGSSSPGSPMGYDAPVVNPYNGQLLGWNQSAPSGWYEGYAPNPALAGGQPTIASSGGGYQQYGPYQVIPGSGQIPQMYDPYGNVIPSGGSNTVNNMPIPASPY